jgi:beta-glucosidase
MTFPKDFVWGAAAASYQVEGAVCEDGRGLSVWDMMCRNPGKVWSGHTGEIGCDHYHRWQEDVELMKAIGLQAYRLSIAWPRILPEGTGKVNPKGLAFYDRLVDALLAAGIQPWVTLFHWDFPYDLYLRGGWLNPDSPQWFADYTQVIVDQLSDRVQHWMTLNEPACFIGLGLQTGEHAPGDRLGFAEVLRAGHHALLAHGQSVQVIRARARRLPSVGFAPCGGIVAPASDTAADIEAARQGMFQTFGRDTWNLALWTDPVFLGRYPEEAIRSFGAAMPVPRAGEMETIAQPVDFCGLNIYHCSVARAGQDGQPETVPAPVGHAMTAMEWPVTPQALYWGPRFTWERYGKPVVITENGMANTDWISADEQVHDPQRIDLLTRYLREFHRAIEDGVEALGYFQWSIMDNFEWSFGYKRRFGLIYVDYPSGRRLLKDSAHWYKNVIATHGAAVRCMS